MALLLEIIILVVIFGFIGILCFYAYSNVMRVTTALKDLATLQVDVLNLEKLANELRSQFSTIKDTFDDLGGVFVQIESLFSSVFGVFGVLRTILGPVCSVTKVAVNPLNSLGSAFGL